MDTGLLNGVSHMRQSTVRIQGSKTIYFDPYDIKGEPGDADIIFISHSHYDHFSVKDIKKVMKSGTILILPGDCSRKAVKEGLASVFTVCPSQNYEVEGLKFSTVPAYNMNKKFHPKNSDWVGYILNINDAAFYFAGDTDSIPEMKGVKADVIFLPVGGTYTMNWREAVDAANIIHPKVAVPIHFKDVVGSMDDARNFIDGIDSTIRGIILKTQ